MARLLSPHTLLLLAFSNLSTGKHNVKETIVVEVKPYKETREPTPQKNLTKKYLYEVKTWSINKSKWEYAIEYCKDRNWKFMILTEKELFKNGNSF